MKLMRGLIIFLVVIFLASVATPAKADAPVRYVWSFSDFFDTDCGKYTVRYEYQGTTTSIAHFDQGFANVHISLQDAFYRTDNVGQIYTHVEQNSLKWTEDEIVHGVNWHMVIPGHGSVILVAGHFMIDWETGTIVYFHGNQNKNNVYPDDVCAAFAE